MPTYEYYCQNEACRHEFEIFQSIKADPLTTCPACNTESLKKKISRGAGIIFKGSGFYETDYKRSPSKESTEASKPKKEADAKPANPAASGA
jgi:putative FmdB family regulatory protein